METSEFTRILWSQLEALPLYLTWLAGLGAAIYTWRRHPTVSILTTVALVVMLALTFASRFVSVLAFRLQTEAGWTAYKVGLFYTVYGCVRAVIEAVAWVLVLVAVFGRRPAAPGAAPPRNAPS